jgi:L-aminopeptidase/D-esterase-like protein
VSNRNLITDVAGVRVGHAGDARLASGATVVLFDQPAVAAADLRGGAPGTRESALLGPAMTVERVDAIALSGGSAFGLDTASGAKAWLAERGRGFAVRTARVPVVPGAILFDLLNGGDKKWGRYPPYRELGYEATMAAAVEFALGSAGAGLGATTAGLKGGIGSASATASGGITIGALAAVNAIGSAVIGDGPHFWAAPFERDGEFGGRGLPSPMPQNALAVRTKGQSLENTTLVVVATDAVLTKEQTQRLAMMAQDGLARALRPIHTPFDGDIVFAAATGAVALADPMQALVELGTVAADVVVRAIARAIYEARALPFPDALPSWKDKFGS